MSETLPFYKVHIIPQNISIKKKILLHERKRHTARRVTSTRCAALSARLVYPHPSRWGGGCVTPIQPDRGVPHLRCWELDGVPPSWHGGTPPPGRAGWGNPPPPGVDRHTPVKTVPSPFLGNAGGNNILTRSLHRKMWSSVNTKRVYLGSLFVHQEFPVPKTSPYLSFVRYPFMGNSQVE